ncbi:acyl-CoA carboxylase epsilon subunit [Streptomyces sp. NPDC017056]|uniref:acyl-CoA carboxylase epsilon subunit n=1 Tax=Streptomyces sp. NPDC017056 TaxID=3364973 RepID=UPI0037959478
MSAADAAADAAIRVLRGRASDEEVAAAVVAILARLNSAAAQRAAATRPPARRRWAAPDTRMTRPPGPRGASAWHAGV